VAAVAASARALIESFFDLRQAGAFFECRPAASMTSRAVQDRVPTFPLRTPFLRDQVVATLLSLCLLATRPVGDSLDAFQRPQHFERHSAAAEAPSADYGPAACVALNTLGESSLSACFVSLARRSYLNPVHKVAGAFPRERSNRCHSGSPCPFKFYPEFPQCSPPLGIPAAHLPSHSANS